MEEPITSIAIDLKEVSYFPPCNFDANCVDTIRQAAIDLGYSQMDVVSGAGHDAIYMNRLAPTGMIFIPCKDGVSHNEIEDAKSEDREYFSDKFGAAQRSNNMSIHTR